jgi:hypothetical protein
MPTSFGTNPPTDSPVESVRNLPSTPLEFDSPCGCRADFEFSMMRAVSHVLAARTTMCARTRCSVPSAVATYTTPVALPVSSVVTSRAMASVSTVMRPVAAAGGSRTDVEEKFECVEHPRPHWPQ